MLRKVVRKINLFDLYIKEAPGDEGEGDGVSVTVAPRANRGTDYSDDPNNITVAPRANRGTDYDMNDDDAPAVADDADNGPVDDTATAEPSAPDVEVGADDTDDATDYNADDTTDDAGGEDPVDADTEPADNPETGAEETGEEDDTDGPDLGDEGTDYGSEGGDENADDTAGEEGDENAPEDTEEQEKKYNFYKVFMNVYDSMEKIITILKGCVKNNPIENAVIKQVTSNFSDMHDILYDYMVVKYPNETYESILSYYETIIIGMKLQIEILKNNKISLKQ